MNKEILKLALPNIISNISVPLLSTVDTILMGQFSAAHLGAVGIGAMIYNFLYWNFGFLRMGTTGMTAQAYGAKDNSEIIHIMIRATLVALIISLIVVALSYPIQLLSFKGFNVIENQEAMVGEYFYIRLLAAPAALSLMALKGWLFGMQNAIFPLLITIVTNVMNIVFSYYLVIVLQLEIRGVAMGTVIGQYSGFLLAIVLIYFKYRSYFEHFNKQLLLKVEQLKRFFVVNSDIFVRTIFLTLAFAFFYSQSSKAGAIMLAVNVILLQMVNWMSYGIDGFAYAAESMVGKYKGKNDLDRINQTIKLSLIWGGLFAVFFSVVYFLAYANIFSLFIDFDKYSALEVSEIERLSGTFKWWMVLFPIAGFLCYIWDGIYIGLTASKAMRNATFISFALYLVFYYISLAQLGEHAIWLALFVFLIGRGLIQSYLYRKKGMDLD